MSRLNNLNRLYDSVIMAVVRVETIERACEITEACLAGGVKAMEISFTLNNAGEVIKELDQRYGKDMLVGAGTVLDSETARIAILAGAKFIIAPNFSKDVAKLCNRYQIPYMPGCTSYTEAVTALEYGAAMIKAFPISNYYGASLGAVFKTPLPFMPIMSSGGAKPENIAEWLKNGVEVIGVGSLLTKGSKEDITQNAQALINAVKAYQVDQKG